MQQPENELRRDTLVLLRHLPFIAVALGLALIVGLSTGLAAGRSYGATAIVQTSVSPLSAALARIPPTSSVVEIARSPQVAQRVAQSLGAATTNDLTSKISVRQGLEGLEVNAQDDSPTKAIELANIWAQAAVSIISSVSADPASISILQQQADGARQRWQEAERALTAAGGDVIVLDEALRATTTTLLQGQRDLASLGRAIELVRRHNTDQSPSLAQLRTAVAGSGVPAEALDGLNSPQELLEALELRRQLLTLSVQSLTGQVDALRERQRGLRVVLAERDAALTNYREAIRLVQAMQLGPLTATITKPAVTATSSGVGWIQRLGAAAAFGLVIGIVGAFGLEALPSLRRWLKHGGEEKAR